MFSTFSGVVSTLGIYRSLKNLFQLITSLIDAILCVLPNWRIKLLIVTQILRAKSKRLATVTI